MHKMKGVNDLSNKRAIKVKYIEKEYINNARLVEYLANKYKERNLKNENL